MIKSAERVNEIGTKQIRSTGSGSKNNPTEPDRQEMQCCPLRNLVQNIEQEGGKPSIDRLSLEMNKLPSSDRASALMALQSTRGNRYVQRVVAQAKLAISQPGDQYEQEADRVAEQVMGMSESHNIQRKCPLRNKDYAIDTKGISGQPSSSIPGINVPLLVDGVLGSPGQPLDSATRTFMEPRLGHDFGHVRVHIDREAAKSARAINALAFTVGSDIVFGKGQYAPEASEGGKLLAHELTHVIQQGSRNGTSLIQRNDDPYHRIPDGGTPQENLAEGGLPGGIPEESSISPSANEKADQIPQPRSLNQSLDLTLLSITELEDEIDKIHLWLTTHPGAGDEHEQLQIAQISLEGMLNSRMGSSEKTNNEDKPQFCDANQGIGAVSLCNRDFAGMLGGLLVPARHCFVWYHPSDMTPDTINPINTSTYDNKTSSTPDAEPQKEGTACLATYDVDPGCVKQKYQTLCSPKEFSLSRFNCCTCANEALIACGAKTRTADFPQQNQGVGLPDSYGTGWKKKILHAI